MSKPSIYIDACPIIDLVKAKRHVELEKDRLNQAWFTERLLEVARDDHIRLITSTVSLVECIHANELPPIPEETKQLFRDFLMSGAMIELVPADIFIGERARNLRWVDGVAIKGNDAIHVATAMEENCVEFITTDAKLEKKLKHLTTMMKATGLSPIVSSTTAHIPEAYRSAPMFTR
jgi:hypothetical protein